MFNKKITVIPPLKTKVTLKADSGGTKTCLHPQDRNVLLNQQKIPNGHQVIIPNRMKMQIIKKGPLPLHQALTNKSCQAKILEGLDNSSLLHREIEQ